MTYNAVDMTLYNVTFAQGAWLRRQCGKRGLLALRTVADAHAAIRRDLPPPPPRAKSPPAAAPSPPRHGKVRPIFSSAIESCVAVPKDAAAARRTRLACPSLAARTPSSSRPR
jgi:hypothetical protein